MLRILAPALVVLLVVCVGYNLEVVIQVEIVCRFSTVERSCRIPHRDLDHDLSCIDPYTGLSILLAANIGILKFIADPSRF